MPVFHSIRLVFTTLQWNPTIRVTHGTGGVLFSTFSSRSQARIKEEGWRLVPAGRKNSRQTYMIDNARRKYNARKSPSIDRPRPRPNVPVCEGLPQQRRLRIKKRDKTQNLHVRFMTANIGSMTGKSRERADIMHRRKIKFACIQETKWKGKEIGEGFKLYYHCLCRARNGI